MQLRKLSIVLIYLGLIAVGAAATILAGIKGTVNVFESNVSVFPQYFSVNISKGVEYVREITVNNTGNRVCVYFKSIVEGPSPDEVRVTFKDKTGNWINFYNPLCLPEGSKDKPSETKVNVHIRVNETAKNGKYSVYIFIKEKPS